MTQNTRLGGSELRSLLKSRPTAGSIVGLSCAEVAEILAYAGFDWLFVDTQHGLNDRESILRTVRTLEAAGVPSVVRAPSLRSEMIGWALDVGSNGVMAPLVNTAADARVMVDLCTYPPRGSRSWGPMRAAMRGLPFPSDEDRPLLSAMIETREGVEAIDAIVDVEGLDLIFVGQSDLALSYGLRQGEGISHPEHRARLERIAGACARAGLQCAINCHSAAHATVLREMGFRHLAMQSDLAMLRGAALQMVQAGAVIR